MSGLFWLSANLFKGTLTDKQLKEIVSRMNHRKHQLIAECKAKDLYAESDKIEARQCDIHIVNCVLMMLKKGKTKNNYLTLAETTTIAEIYFGQQGETLTPLQLTTKLTQVLETIDPGIVNNQVNKKSLRRHAFIQT